MNSSVGTQGLAGPASISHFEMEGNEWSPIHAEINQHCLEISRLLGLHPQIARTVIITKENIVASK